MALEKGVRGVAEFYLHRVRTEKAVVCGLVGPMGGVKQGIPTSIDLVPKVHGVLQVSIIVGNGEVVVVHSGNLWSVEETSASLLI